jgi:nucleoside diphosphate kinase
MFAPSRKLVEEYSRLLLDGKSQDPAMRDLLADYVMKSYAPDPIAGLPRRVMMILLEGEDAVGKVREMAGPVIVGGGETIRDTFGDYVVDEHGKVQYFEPAVLIGSDREETAAALKLWGRYAISDGGLLQSAVDIRSKDTGWQRTLVVIKPDNFRFPMARPGNIIDLLSRSGLRIMAANVHRMSVIQAEEFYKPVRNVLREKMKNQIAERATKVLEAEFSMDIPADVKVLLTEQLGPLLGDEQFNQIVKFMTGYYPPNCAQEDRGKEGRHKCLAMIYGGVNAVEKIRKLLGSTDPNKAQPGSVRREFGHDIMINAAHASDSVESAEREIAIVKVEEDLINPLISKYYG